MCSVVDTTISSLTFRSSSMPVDDGSKTTRRQHKEEYRKQRQPEQDRSDRASTSTTPDGSQLVLTVLDAHRRDVFRTTPISLDGISLEAVDEHLQILHTEELVLQIAGGTHHPVLTALFPAAMQDPCLFTCFLAATQSFYEHRRTPGRFAPSDYLLGLQAKGLAGIRDRIMQAGNGQDDNLIAGIIELMVTDSICGNVASLISHQRGARKLMALRKGGDDESPLFKTMLGVLVVIEFYVALVQFLSPEPTTPPAGDSPLKYLKHPFPATVCVSISVLPQGLEDLVLTGRLSLQTINLLQKVNSWSSAVQEISSGSEQVQAAYRRLFAEPMDCSRSAVFILRHLRKSDAHLTIEYILLVGITIIIKHQGSTNITNHLDDELLNVFIRTIKQFAHPTPTESDTIIWLATAVAWRKQTTFPTHSQHLIDHILRTRDPTVNLHAIQIIWSKFLWSDRFVGSWTRLWQAGLDRTRQHRDRSHSSSAALLEYRGRGMMRAPPQSCAFSHGMAATTTTTTTIKKEDSADSTTQSMPLTLVSARSWTLSDDETRSQPNEMG